MAGTYAPHLAQVRALAMHAVALTQRCPVKAHMIFSMLIAAAPIAFE